MVVVSSTAPRSLTHPLDEDALQHDVTLLSTLGNNTRYEALRLIHDAGENGACVCEIHPALGVSQSATSQALAQLTTAGLLTRRKEGRWRYYATTTKAQRILTTLDHARKEKP